MAGKAETLPTGQTTSPVLIVASSFYPLSLWSVYFKKPRTYLVDWFYHENLITCFHETIKAVHSWPWWLEWLEGCKCWVGYGGGAEAGVSELRAHFRETHLFPLSIPDGQKSLSQDPADCLRWKYTQIVDAHTQWSNTENPGLVRTAQKNSNSTCHFTGHLCSFLNLLHFLLILDPVTPKPGVLPQLQVAAWYGNLFSPNFIPVFTALSPRRGRLRIFSDGADNSVCFLLQREQFQQLRGFVSAVSLKSLLTTEFPGLNLHFHYYGGDIIFCKIDCS